MVQHPYRHTSKHLCFVMLISNSFPINEAAVILVRNTWRSFSARILQSGNPERADEPRNISGSREKFQCVQYATGNHGNPQPSFLGVITHILGVENLHFSWFWGPRVYVAYQLTIIYSFLFTANHVCRFLLASFFRQKMLRLVLSWRSWTDTASTCFSDSAVRVNNTFAMTNRREWFC